MSDAHEGPSILASMASVMGQNIEVISYVDPQQFPDGMELVLMAPGKLEPLGRGVVRKGCMVAIVPPEMAARILELLQAQAAKQPQPQGGQVRAPGLRG